MKRIINTVIYCCFFVLIANSQANIDLNEELTQSVDCRATNRIRLKKGFKFNSQSGERFTGDISWTFESDNPDSNIPIGYDMNSSTFGTGAPGTLPFKVDVDPSGNSTASLAFDLPVGFGGMVPQLGLSYSSMGTNGEFGTATSLAGITRIIRTGRTHYYDGETAPISFTSKDKLVLGGSRLIAEDNNKYGQASAEYTLENDNFSKIVASTNMYQGAPESYIMEMPDGTKIVFGGAESKCKQVLGDGKKTLSWLISTVTDRRGNSMEYTYIERSDGQVEIDKILYTKNEEGDISPQYEVDFEYRESNNKTTYYIGGYGINNNLLLTDIVVRDIYLSTELVRYKFSYSRGSEQLYDVNKYIGGVQSTNSAIIGWNKINTVKDVLKSDVDVDFIPTHDNVSMVNHIGIFEEGGDISTLRMFYDNISRSYPMELVSNEGVDVKVQNIGTFPVNNIATFTDVVTVVPERGDGLESLVIFNKYYEPIDVEVTNTTYLPSCVADINDDGVSDICFMVGNKSLDPDDASFQAYSVINGVSTLIYKKSNIGEPAKAEAFISGDFTGTGVVDVLRVGVRTDFGDQASLTSSGSEERIYNTDNLSGMNFGCIELDGDGVPEVLSVSKYGARIYKPYKDGGIYRFEYISSGIPSNTEVYPGEFNGDGLTDLMVYTSEGWVMYYSNGKRFVKGNTPYELNALEGAYDIGYEPPAFECPDPFDLGFPYCSTDPNKTYFNTVNSVQPFFDEFNSSDNKKLEHPRFDNHESGNASTYCTKYCLKDLNNDGITDIIRFERYVWFDDVCTKINATSEGDITSVVNKKIGNLNEQFGMSVFMSNSEDGDYDFEYIEGPRFSQGKNDHRIKIADGVDSKIGNMPLRFKPNGGWNGVDYMFWDIDGDDIQELHLFSEEQIEFTDGTYDVVDNQTYQFAKGESNRLLKSVSTTPFVKTSLEYKKLTEDGIYTKEELNESLPADVKELLIPLKVVSKKSLSVQGTKVSDINIKYKNIRLHNKRGLLGFAKVEMEDIISKNRTFVEYRLNNDYLLPYTYAVSNYFNDRLISKTTNTPKFVPRSGNRQYLMYIEKTVNSDEVKRIDETTTVQIDETKGYTISKKVSTASFSVLTNYSDFNKYGSPQNVKVTRTQNGTFSTQKSFTYDNYGNVLKETDNDGNSTTYTYNTSDNTRVETIKESVLESTIKLKYDYSKKNVIEKELINRNGKKEYSEFFDYNAYGQLLEHTDKNGLVTKNQYDVYGKKVATLFPDGNCEIISYGWNGAGSYLEVNDVLGNHRRKEIDARGRVVKTETKPAGGEIVTVQKEYNALGQLDYETTSVDGVTNYSYEAYGRLSSLSSKGTEINYSYRGRTVNTIQNNKTKTEYTNSIGQVVKVLDSGGTIVYDYHPSGNPSTITCGASVVSMEYDDKGRQTKLIDPDAGTVIYTYDDIGRLETTTDAAGNITKNIYDNVTGLLAAEEYTKGEGVGGLYSVRTVSYQYYTEAPHMGMIKKATDSESGISTEYTYDNLGRVLTVTENIEGVDYTFTYEYDIAGNITRIIYPDGYELTQTYNGNYLTKIHDVAAGKDIFTNFSYNARGQVTDYNKGNGGRVSNSYDQYGYLFNSDFIYSNGSKHTYGYTFNHATGMLDSRIKTLNNRDVLQYEEFTYDDLYRLTGWKVNNGVSYSMNYAANGNIVQKSDIGLYAYSGIKPHAVTSVSQLEGTGFNTKYTGIKHNVFNSISSIDLAESQGEAVLATYKLTYAHDNQRRITEYNGLKTTYVGLFEKRSDGKVLHYIPTPDGMSGLMVTDNGVNTMYYLHNDHLGSLVAAESEHGELTEFSYDPWGRRRNPNNWSDYDITYPTLFTRGYTGHEHIDELGLINMNGRMYDPRLGRMLQPDNYVQSPDFSQGFNRYSYCYNNPLMYTDPNGENPFLVAALIIGGCSLFGGYVGGAVAEQNFNPFSWKWDNNTWRGVGTGAAIGAVVGSVGYFGGIPIKLGFTLNNNFIGITIAAEKAWTGLAMVGGAAGTTMATSLIWGTEAGGGGEYAFGGDGGTPNYVQNAYNQIENVRNEYMDEWHNGSGGGKSTFDRFNYLAGLKATAATTYFGNKVNRWKMYQPLTSSTLSLKGSSIFRTASKCLNIAKGAGTALTFGGIAYDYGIGVQRYNKGIRDEWSVSPLKAGVNTGVSLYTLGSKNPSVGVIYFGIDAFYPGGWPSAIRDQDDLTRRNREILGPNWNLYRMEGGAKW